MDRPKVEFVVKIPMGIVDIVRIAHYLREGYSLVDHLDYEQEQPQEQEKAKGAAQ